MNYKSFSDLNLAVKKWISTLPKDFDLIVGIPRSGLLVANLLALYLNKPLTDVEGLCEGRILSAGPRYGKRPDFSKIRKVLVVDDSVCSGSQMRKTKAIIEKANLPFDIYYGAVYVTPRGTKEVDFWCEIVNLPRVFEWNIMHHDILQNSCVDLDGVICRDPAPEENDDGQKYKEFIKNAELLIIPTKKIGWIVTCRLEKYRYLTKEWLRKHGVQYDHLIMLNLPDKETRQKLRIHAKYKAEVYKSTKAILFIESSKEQAYEIVRLTGKPVLCTETNEMINPGILPKVCNNGRELISKAINDPFAALIKVPRFSKRKIDNIRWRIVAAVKNGKAKRLRK